MFMTINKNCTKGLTLIELLIAVSISSIGILGSYSLISNIRNTVASQSEAVQAQQSARNIMERMAREIRESKPEYIWTTGDLNVSEPTILFLTPRDENNKFSLDSNGKPLWKGVVMYRLDSSSKDLFRYKSSDPDIISMIKDSGNIPLALYNIRQRIQPTEEEASSNFDLEGMSYNPSNEIISLSVKTVANFTDRQKKNYNSFALFRTKVRSRN